MHTNHLDLGPFLKRLRVERHITLQAVSPDSVSALSRFESGKSTLSTGRLATVMARESVWFEDLVTQSDVWRSDFVLFAEQLMALRYRPDQEVIEKMIISELNRPQMMVKKFQVPIVALLKMIQRSVQLNRPERLSKIMQQQIEALLLDSSDWILFDYYLFRLSVGYLDDKVLWRCFKHAEVVAKQAPHDYQTYFEMVAQQVTIVELSRHRQTHLDQLREALIRYQPNLLLAHDSYSIQLLLALVDCVETSCDDSEALQQVRDTLKVLELPDMLAYTDHLIAVVLTQEVGLIL